jgi:hypothetical protein
LSIIADREAIEQRAEEEMEPIEVGTELDVIDLNAFDKMKHFLFCSVCSDIYKDPLNVRQCLHKFCAGCIEDYNRV